MIYPECQEKNLVFLGEGRHRKVYYDPKRHEVIKFPKCCLGESDNQHENCLNGTIYAKSRLDKILTEKYGVYIIRMEYVEPTGSSDKPDWTWSIDCGQVGRTFNGRLVAYDYGYH